MELRCWGYSINNVAFVNRVQQVFIEVGSGDTTSSSWVLTGTGSKRR